MSNEVAENLREIASNLLAAANRLDGIDVTYRHGTLVSPAPATKFVIMPIGDDAISVQCDGLRCSPDHVMFDNGAPEWRWPTLEQINRAAREHLEREHGFGA